MADKELEKKPSGGAANLIPGAGGGPQPGSGRPSDAFRARCRAALEKAKAIEVAEQIISGDILEQVGVDDDGKPIIGTTKNSDRLKSMEFLTKYGHGAPPQSLELTGPDGAPFVPPQIVIQVVQPTGQ